MRSINYVRYIQSKEWQEFRRKAIVNAGLKCQRCGRANTVLQVHHLHYNTLQKESFTDVLVLCIPCHEIEDKNREHSDGLETFASKKYGNDWFISSDRYDEVEQKFNNWLEKKEREEHGY